MTDFTQDILQSLDKLQNDIYLKVQRYEKYIYWSSFFIYGSDIKKCSKDILADPRCSEEYRKFIQEYNINPQNYIAYITSLNSNQMSFNVADLKDIAVYIKSVTTPTGHISIEDEAEKNKILTAFGEYLGAIIYFGKTEYFMEEFNNFIGLNLSSNTGAYFEALFGDTSGLSNRKSLYQQQIDTQLKLLNQQITTEKKLKEYGGVFIKNISYAPTILIQEYNQVSQEYREGFKELYDILKTVPELQFCLSKVEVGDINTKNVSNSDININCEAISNCIKGNTTNIDKDSKSDTNSGTDIETDQKNNIEHDSKTKSYIIILLIIFIFLIIIFGIGIYLFTKKNDQINSNN